MTKSELLESVKKFVPDQMVTVINLPVVLAFVAADLWVSQEPEDADTARIREAMRDLDTKGHFDFREEGV